MSDVNYAGPDLIFELEGRPPFHQALVGAIVHLLAIFVPMTTPALIVGATLQLFAEATAYLVSIAMIVSGIGTWLQVNRYGIVGSGLLPVRSVNFSFVIVMITLGSDVKSDGFHKELVMSSFLGVSFVGVFLATGSSSILPYLRRVITPTVSGIMVLMISLSLIKVGIIDFGGGFAARSSGTFGNYEHPGAGLSVLIVVTGPNCCRSSLLRIGGIAIGLYVDCIVSLCLGMMGFGSMRNLPLITVPHPFKYSFSFSFHQFLVVDTVYLPSVLEVIGDITATAMTSRHSIQGREYQFQLEDSVLIDSLVSAIVSAVGSLPLTTFVQNNGVVQMIGVASRYAGRTTVVMLVILSLFPMIGSFLTTIPSTVLEGAMMLMFFMIVIAGIRITITNGLKRREILIVATLLDLRPGISYDPEIFRVLPAFIYVLVKNPICAGRLTATLLDTILPDGY